ncbi:MAG TPA: GNAT family N-acetyltransferase [Opitutaceae bacterium]|nr:GNAT family N-acetyltransferase [Opitutaceae bacterium]
MSRARRKTSGAPAALEIRIRRARLKDAAALTRLALAAKRHWGYPPSWLRQWRRELTLTPDYLRAHPVFAAFAGRRLVGFSALVLRRRSAWLDHLWVRPRAMGRGVGRALFLHAERAALEAGAPRLRIEGDPHAEGFYLRMGARRAGRKSAAVDGVKRFLPLFEKPLAPRRPPVTSAPRPSPR